MAFLQDNSKEVTKYVYKKKLPFNMLINIETHRSCHSHIKQVLISL